MSKTIKQFKLTNDDEIICEVLEWDNQDSSAILVRGALRIITMEDFSKGVRFFAFRPWMSLSDDPQILQTVNAAHVIGEINPSDQLLKNYAKTLLQIQQLVNEKTEPRFNVDLDQVLSNMPSDMTEEEFDDFLMDHLSDDTEFDSHDGAKIIKFKPKGTIH